MTGENFAAGRPRRTMIAKQLWAPRHDATYTPIASTDLYQGDYVLVEAGDLIPGDGEVVEGCAAVDQAAVTGERAPVIRQCGGDRSSVTAGMQVVSDWLVIRITAAPPDVR
jgi:potassium-transporting ATPase ATP-binding subunit